MPEAEIKFEDVGAETIGVVLKVMQDFPEAANYSYKVLYRLTKKSSGGRVVLAYICLPSDLAKYFSGDEKCPNGYDFVLVLDKRAWGIAEADDRVRIIRHELCHVGSTKSGNPALLDHDVQDFHSEIVKNADKPDWSRRLAEILVAAYDQDNAAKKSKGKGKSMMPKGR
jgi:hypothetical protein